MGDKGYPSEICLEYLSDAEDPGGEGTRATFTVPQLQSLKYEVVSDSDGESGKGLTLGHEWFKTVPESFRYTLTSRVTATPEKEWKYVPKRTPEQYCKDLLEAGISFQLHSEVTPQELQILCNQPSGSSAGM